MIKILLLCLFLSGCSSTHVISTDCFHGDTWGERAAAACENCKNNNYYDSCWIKNMTVEGEVVCECKDNK